MSTRPLRPAPAPLRQAIVDANAAPGTNNIVFDIPSSGPQVIQLQAALPTITNPVNILGDSQPGFSTSHVFLPGPAVLAVVSLIVIDGTNAGAGTDGLTFAAGSDQSQATYLVVRNFSGDGVVINNSASDRLFNLVVQRNGGNGVHITGPTAHDNFLQNSFIGTDFSGTQSTDDINGVSQFVGNSGDGVLIDNLAHDNTLGGGKYFLYKNVIGDNAGNGLHITGGASRNLIQANFIGAAAGNDGTALPNAGDGMLVEGNSDGNQLGGVLGLGGLVSGNMLKASRFAARLRIPSSRTSSSAPRPSCPRPCRTAATAYSSRPVGGHRGPGQPDQREQGQRHRDRRQRRGRHHPGQ